ncbi:MAG: carbohydrate ABC transporter permease [Clostridiales bacterium]|uniref:carbohydrate ABC transporter permease n=1 Tax=Terrisporobacter sp. TaxID=1965305 RepID=UPI002A4FA542|nr:carbohydrate ABC transporter permease [Terrisporobacter sp.]MDD7757207.1 carbohydrate ABC transporter permease [Clostridiales bacterium]MDY4135613.1 carbohydrate ABC transporter permease [Terrisporobacter sp.]MDY4735554.1 carbohydrate ABC transporter permease [Terrisporobacter sp.]
MKSKKRKIIEIVICLIMIGVSLFFLFPVIWMVVNSFKGDAQIIQDMNTMSAFKPPSLDGNFFSNYVTIIQSSDLMKYMANTVFYSAVLIVLSILVNGLAGYALAKIKFPFREGWVLVITLLMIVPAETIITINYMMIAKAGLLNNLIGYILPMIVNPFNIFLFRQVFIQLPDELREAAEMDHCSTLKYFLQIVLPMSKSVVATVSVFTFLGVWNDFIWPSLIFTSNDLLTVQIGLNSITANDNTTVGQVLATISLITIPVIIIYSLFSKQIVEGVTTSGTKEG